MGALGTGPFENDDARDFLAGLEDLTPEGRADAVLDAFDEVLHASGHVHAGAMSAAVAAAAAVGASRNAKAAAKERQRPGWLVAEAVPVPDETAEKARRVLRRAVRSKNNEWWELWQEAEVSADVEDACARALGWLGDRDD